MSESLKAGGKFTHRIEMTGGHYLIRPEPAKNYGVSSVRIWFYVIGPMGAVQWQIGTDWFPLQAREHLRARGWPSEYDVRDAMKPKGWDLGYHSKEPRYEGQSPMDGECQVLGCKCYYDGSGLNADLLIEGFIHGGTEWLWPQLEEYYASVFEGAPFPAFTAVPQKHPDDVKAEAALSKARLQEGK